jgi:hypothetical protein
VIIFRPDQGRGEIVLGQLFLGRGPSLRHPGGGDPRSVIRAGDLPPLPLVLRAAVLADRVGLIPAIGLNQFPDRFEDLAEPEIGQRHLQILPGRIGMQHLADHAGALPRRHAREVRQPGRHRARRRRFPLARDLT